MLCKFLPNVKVMSLFIFLNSFYVKASYVKTNRSYYLTVILECTSWIVHAMVDILGNQRKKVLTRCVEHQPDSIKSNWELSCVIEHTKECHEQFTWILPKTIAVMSNIDKKRYVKPLR